MDRKKKDEILAAAVSAEEVKALEWARRRRTPKNIMSPSARQGQYLHISGRARSLLGKQLGMSPGEQYEPNKNRPAPQPRRSKAESKRSTKAQRAKADRAAKKAKADA